MNPSNKKILKDLDNSQKEALKLLNENQIELFMKKTYHEFLNECINYNSIITSDYEKLKEMAEKQAEYRTFFFNESKRKGAFADSGIFEANLEHEYTSFIKHLIKDLFLKLDNINKIISDFLFEYNNLSLIIRIVYERECCYYNYPKFLQEVSHKSFKNYEKFEKKFTNILFEDLLKENYIKTKELKEEIIQYKNNNSILKDLDSLKEFKELEFLDDSVFIKIDNLELIYKSILSLIETLEPYFNKFDVISEDGFKELREKYLNSEVRDDYLLPSNYILDMKEFKVKIKD